MHEDNTTYAEDALAGIPEEGETPVMDTGLDREIPMPEVNDNYVNNSVLLPRKNIYSRGEVIRRKIYAYGIVIGSINNNPILDTHEYNVEFDDGEVSELTVNVIADSMYSACNDDGNDYLMM